MAEPADSVTQITALRTAITALMTQEAALRTSQGHLSIKLSQPDTRERFGTLGDGYDGHLRQIERFINVLEKLSARWS